MDNKNTRCEDCSTPESGVYCNEEYREIYLFGTISGPAVMEVIINLRNMDKAGKENITFVMNSDGGSVSDGFALYDVMCACRSKIIGIVLGNCYSMATLVLQGCDTRIIGENSRFMIHDTSINGLERVSKTELDKITSEIRNLDSKYNKIMAEKSGLDIDTIEELCKKETYLDAEQTVEYGWADCILGKAKRRIKSVSKRK